MAKDGGKVCARAGDLFFLLLESAELRVAYESELVAERHEASVGVVLSEDEPVLGA